MWAQARKIFTRCSPFNYYYIADLVPTYNKIVFVYKLWLDYFRFFVKHVIFFNLFMQQLRATRYSSHLKYKSYRVRHIFFRSTPPPPKMSLPLTDFWIINFLWISACFSSREEWYHGLIEFEVYKSKFYSAFY